ncbi:redoxin domain-containing protein [Tautonia rosea]|uniref:redoxin domain-containing protein n=1 Tax=Tautonia rosea TaxID=2728037 RepID=UPI001472D339|nr:redoxin domain-containing protein [Tautonia rosea]
MFRPPLVSVTAFLLTMVSGLSPVDALPQEQNFDPGHSLLRRVAEAYARLPGYADEGTMTLSFALSGEETSQTLEKPFAFARPNRLAVAQEPAAFYLDGQQQLSALAGLYLRSEAPDVLTPSVLARDPAAAYIFGGITGIPSMTLFRLLASEDPYEAILQGVERLEREPERSVDGVECRSLKIVPQAGPVVRFLIDPQSYLLRRIEVVPAPKELPETMVVKEISWSPGTISTEVPPADRFVYTPPEDARRVESIAALMAGPDGTEPGAGLKGKPAPQFSLKLLAADGTIESSSREELAGKVVVIDVWTTWFDPCVAELQALSTLIDRFEDHPSADRLRVISLSMDTPAPDEDDTEDVEEPADDEKIAEIRTLVERFLEAKDFRLDRPPMARVAIDPTGETAQALGIEAIPMLLVMDSQGVVREVLVASPPQAVLDLAPTIDALLDADRSDASKPSGD